MIGDNAPVDSSEEIIARLRVDYQPEIDAVRAHLEAARQLPPEVTDKESHDLYADLVTRARATYKNLEAERVAQKDPYLRAERAVDGFFDPLKMTLTEAMKALSAKVKAFLDTKAAEERRAREEAAREARLKAERLRELEQAKLREAEAAKRRDTADRNTRLANEAASRAAQAEVKAYEAEIHAADASNADLARTRSDRGTLSTLQTYWAAEITDAGSIPLETLRPYIPAAVIEKAVAQFVKMGGRELQGVRIYEATKSLIR